MPKTDPPEKKLTGKQARFVEEYPVDSNATQAAIRAGYSEKTAYSAGQRLLKDVEIKAAIDAKRKKVSEKLEITRERILEEYARIGFSDIRKTLTPGGNLLNPNDWDDDTAAAIAGIEVVTKRLHAGDNEGLEVEYTHKIKTWDKPKALDAMAKHLGMFDGKKGVDDPEDTPEAENLRAMGRKLAFVLAGALGEA